MKTILEIGFARKKALPAGACLFISDVVPKLPEWRRAKVFDYHKHHLNPLEDLDYRKSCAIVDAIDALFPGGKNTLTKETGLEFIGEALERKPASLEDLVPKPDVKSSTGHVWAYGKMRRILRSPVLRKVLCGKNNLKLKPHSTVLAKLDRAELGDFDALALGFFLMLEYKGQVVVSDFGFHGRDMHVALLVEKRLMAGVNSLSELPASIRDSLPLFEKRVPRRVLPEDAETLARYAGLRPDPLKADNPFNDFVRDAMA